MSSVRYRTDLSLGPDLRKFDAAGWGGALVLRCVDYGFIPASKELIRYPELGRIPTDAMSNPKFVWDTTTGGNENGSVFGPHSTHLFTQYAGEW